MKTELHLRVKPMPTAQDREKALALAIQWHAGYDPPLNEVLKTARRFAEFIADGHDSDGICGNESVSPFAANTAPEICHLRFGHGSLWHESETGQRWKYGDYSSALPVPAPVERGPVHDPPPGLS